MLETPGTGWWYAAASELATLRSKSAPRAATPMASPPVRKVLLIPEAMPDRSGATTPKPIRAIAGLTMPMPRPVSNNPGMRTSQVEEALMANIVSMPTAVIAMPAPSTSRGARRLA